MTNHIASPLAPVQFSADAYTRYTMCDKCGQGVESWLMDDSDCGTFWSAWGTFSPNAAGFGTLNKVCQA